MKILLLGDYSGFHKNLKEGLIELGHYVDISSTGDGYKQTTDSDLYIPKSKNSVLRKIDKLLFPFTKITQYYGYDFVQMINHNVFGGLKYNYNYWLIKKIKKHSGKIFLSSCGTNYFVYKKRAQWRYNYIDSTINKDLNGRNKYIEPSFINNNIRVANLVDGIIPNSYNYRVAYEEQPSILNTIPFPINVNKILFKPQIIKNNKLKIFHGITREGFKGSEYIREAMMRIKKNYPNDVEVLIDGGMPLTEYIKVLEETNVVVDQALSYGYGMNAMYSMAMGKVVLGGNEPETQQEFGRTDIPVINITPSVEDIYNKLEKLVLDKKSVIKIGEKSRIFVEDFHHHVKVAQQYIDAWNSVEVKK